MPGPMGGPMRAGQTTQKAKDFKKTTKKLIKSYLAKYKIAIFVVILFAVGSTIFTIVGPKILGNATTEIFNGLMGKLSGGSGIDFEKVGRNSHNINSLIYNQCIILLCTRIHNDNCNTKNHI